MKKLNILESFKSTKFKYGSYATIITAIFLAILLGVNLIAAKIPLRLDLTKNRFYSLSDQTFKVLNGLKKEVKIIGLAETGKENSLVVETLERYQNASSKVSFEFKDPVRLPQIVQKYNKGGLVLKKGSLIVECGEKYKVILPDDMIAEYGGVFGEQGESYLVLEEKLTSAIMNVTSDKSYTVYALQRHGEESLKILGLEKYLESENYEIKDLDLITQNAVPEDASALLVMSPEMDLHPEEDKLIREYLAGGGRAIFVMDPQTEKLPIFDELFRSYGAALQDEFIVEANSSYATAQNPVVLLPKLGEHDILKSIQSKGVRILFPISKGIEILDTKRRSVEISPLLVTSKDAYGAQLDGTVGELRGPFNVAVAISDKKYGEKIIETRIVLISNSGFINPEVVKNNSANLDLFMNGVNWLQERSENLSIRPKRTEKQRLSITALNAYIFSGVVVFVIPIIALTMGLVVWMRRRHL